MVVQEDPLNSRAIPTKFRSYSSTLSSLQVSFVVGAVFAPFTPYQTAEGLQPETLCARQRDPPIPSTHKCSLIASRISNRTGDSPSVREYQYASHER